MKKYFTTNKTFSIIILTFLLFAISYCFDYFLKISLPLYFTGFFLALFIPGFAIKNIIDREDDIVSNLLAAPIFTMFFFIPVYYAITLFLDGKINIVIGLLMILATSAISFILTNKKKDLRKTTYRHDKYILFGVGVFLLVHLATTLAYRFVPEIDGYSDIIKIENILSSGIFSISYRPLFTFFVTYLSTISKIQPYWLFKFGMLAIQLSGIFCLYQIIKSFNLKNSFAKFVILLALVSVPVINLEIDYIRPNVVFIAALIPFIYYLSKGLDGNKKFLITSSIISIVGTMYHEFFILLFVINFIFIFLYFWKNATVFKKFIITLFTFISSILILANIKKITSLQSALGALDNIISLLANGITWSWWPLGTYLNMDGNNLGWSGLDGTSKYYAYFLSPFLFFVFIFYAYTFLRKLKQGIQITSLEKIALSLLLIGLTFSELLPRINFKTLPDRFWPLISISLIVLLIPTLSKLENLFSKKITRIIVIFIILIGIGGSIFMAKAKSGYTSEKEYTASTWIKQNTSTDAIFITQGGNGPMLSYFANRKAISPFASFFIKKSNLQGRSEIPISQNFLNNATTLFNASLDDPSDENLFSLNTNLKNYHEEFEKEKLINNLENPAFKFPENNDIYVLYSNDKFNNYYGQRQWWRDANFYGANLEKFKDGYDLVYNDNDIIYIWKKK